MSRWLRIAGMVLAPVMLLATLIGCSGRGDNDDTDVVVPPGQKRGGGAASALQAVGIKAPDGKITAPPTTTIKGRIVLKEGTDPDFTALDAAFRAGITKDNDHCFKGMGEEVTQNTWVVDKASRGVKYVFVWLRPLDDRTQFFDVSNLVAEKKGFPLAVSMDQPHCAFQPHAAVLFPRYIDPKSPSDRFKRAAAAGGPPETPQKFVVKNSAPIAHNTNWTGKATAGGSFGVAANGGTLDIANIQPSYSSGVELSCSIHPWMKAYVWAFPHPFAAITNEKGEFTIENAPADVELRIVAWHEAARWVIGEEGGKKSEDGKVVKLKAGKHDEPTIEISGK